ncbi:MAG: hypothetical protein QOD39_2662 [Mycobacterium sp.]|jgi:hypothetical protein|nr:hypothetical protein [Mycobacterium sp.]
MSKTAMLGSQVALACAVVLLAACTTDKSPESDLKTVDIARVKDLKSTFGPEFKVTEVGPTGVDPKLLGPQTVPPGMKFDPADCFGATQIVPPGLKGNMAATTAEGKGNRFIAIAVETSDQVPIKRPVDNCKKVGFAGGSVRGLVEVVEAPHIDGVETLGIHRVVQTVVEGKRRTGELYNYIASFGPFLVIVTANSLVVPNQPGVPVDTKRAADLLTAAVAAVRG